MNDDITDILPEPVDVAEADLPEYQEPQESKPEPALTEMSMPDSEGDTPELEDYAPSDSFPSMNYDTQDEPTSTPRTESSSPQPINVEHQLHVNVSIDNGIADEISNKVAPVIREIYDNLLEELRDTLDREAIVNDRRHTVA